MTATSPPPFAPESSVARLMAEGLIGLSAAAKRLGSFRDGRPTHPGTLARWATDGVTMADGRTLRLEAVRLNGRWATSEAAIVRFVEAQQTDDTPPEAPPPARTPAARRRAGERAAARLVEMGC